MTMTAKTRRRTPQPASSGGFTLAEILVAFGIVAVLMTLGAGAVRNYWLTQSLFGGRDELVSQLRRAQEQAVSETHPKVFGVRLQAGSSTWGLIEYNPSIPSCTEIQTNRFGSSTRPQSATFASAAETTYCQANLRYPNGSAVPDAIRTSSSYAFFYARGTATGGTVVLENPLVPGKNPSLIVTPITGRVTST